MPNWATCTISFAGPTQGVAAIRDSLAPSGDDSNCQFDFDKLLPTPPELLDVVSPMRIVDDQESADAINKDFGGVRAVTRATAQRFLGEYGAADRYQWRLGNWGTKWTGSYAKTLLDSPDELIVRFDTAWTEPGQLLQTLACEDGSEFAPVAYFPDDADDADPQELFEQRFVVREETVYDPDEPEFTWVDRWIELAA